MTDSSLDVNKSQREKLLKLASYASVLVALILVVIKGYAWILTGSVALLGSLLDSILDAAASTLNVFFIRSALRPADSEHRFGHGKAEPIGGMIQAMIIGGSAVFLIAESIRRMIYPEMPENTGIGISIMLISSLLVGALVMLQHYVIKRTNSFIISADALHGFGDIIINLGVIAALLIAKAFDTPLIDPIIAIALAALLIRGAWSIARDAIGQLMDSEFTEQERDKIRDVALEHPEVNDIHDLRTRRAGFSSFIQLHIEMDGSMPLNQSHKIADNVEKRIQAEFPDAEVLIHQDPAGAEHVDSFLRS